MCTVSFIARRRGYLLAMNRDEQLSRGAGLPPKIISVSGRKVVCPTEPGGGTWISVNDAGVTFALINWYSVKSRVKKNPVSRGGIVKSAGAHITSTSVSEMLAEFPLQHTNPFRLIGVFPVTREIVEWRWNLQELVRKNHPWRERQFISSGFYEPGAQRIRSRIFRLAQRQKSAGTLGWLRRLHRSHKPGCGPFSTCMHRADAATVSYTEVMVSPGRFEMRHLNGSLCRQPAAILSSTRQIGLT